MVSTTEPSKAARKPRTANPGVNREASLSSRALSASRNKPRVSNVTGKNRNLRTGPITALTRAMTMVATSAEPNPLSSMPGMILCDYPQRQGA